MDSAGEGILEISTMISVIAAIVTACTGKNAVYVSCNLLACCQRRRLTPMNMIDVGTSHGNPLPRMRIGCVLSIPQEQTSSSWRETAACPTARGCGLLDVLRKPAELGSAML